MRLNGWQRIGLVGTICWIIGGGFWINSQAINDLGAPVVAKYRICLESRSVRPNGSVPQDTDWGPCTARFERDFGPAVADHWFYAAVFTLVPIPFVWLAVFFLAATGQWIRAGFKKSD
jgi:hypothetical protein